jgi:hypothetical protein
MPKNSQYIVDKPRIDEKKKIHPVWRGIGCVLMVLIPFVSYFAAVQIISMRNQWKWVIIPEEIIAKTGNDPLIYVKLVYAFVIALLLFLIMGVITFVTNQAAGTSRKNY